MAFSLGQLIYEIILKGANEVTAGLRSVADASSKTADAQEKTDEATKQSTKSFASLTGEAHRVALAITALGASFSAFSGLNLAAKYESVEVGLTNITHSASKARAMLGDLIKMGQETPYNTSDLVGFSRGLLTAGLETKEATRALRSFAAVGANLSLPVGEVGEIARLMSELRGSSKGRVDVFEALSLRGVNITEVLAAGGGPNFTGKYSKMKANQYLGSMPGEDAFNIVLKGLEKLNPAPAQTFLSIMQNMGEAFQNIMLPTGRLLLPVIGALGTGLTKAANAVGAINEKTGGAAGLVIIFGTLWRTKELLIGSASRAVVAIQALATSINQLSVSSATGAAVNAASGAATATGAASVAFGMKSLWPRLMGGGFKALLPALSKMAGPLMGGLKLGTGVGIATLGTELLGNALQTRKDKNSQEIGKALSEIGGSAGTGALIGGAIGMFVGPIGAATGAAIGASLGLIFAAIKHFWEEGHKANPSSDPTKQTAENTKRMADSLESLSGRLIGPGGRNSNRSISQIEMEESLARALLLT